MWTQSGFKALLLFLGYTGLGHLQQVSTPQRALSTCVVVVVVLVACTGREVRESLGAGLDSLLRCQMI